MLLDFPLEHGRRLKIHVVATAVPIVQVVILRGRVVDDHLLPRRDLVQSRLILAVSPQRSQRVKLLPIECVERLEELSAGRVCLIFLAEQMVRAVLKQLLIRPLLELSLHLEVLLGDTLHVGRLLDLILAYHLLYVHLEALTAAKRVAILRKDDDIARIDRLLVVIRVLGLFRDLLDRTQSL